MLLCLLAFLLASFSLINPNFVNVLDILEFFNFPKMKNEERSSDLKENLRIWQSDYKAKTCANWNRTTFYTIK